MYGTRQCILHQCFNASGCYSVEQFNRFISCNSETAQSWKAQADWTIFASLCWHANRVYMQHTIRLHLGVCFICCWEGSKGISMVFFAYSTHCKDILYFYSMLFETPMCGIRRVECHQIIPNIQENYKKYRQHLYQTVGLE